MSVMTENTLAGSGGLRRCCSSAPDGLDYEPVIRSGHYLVLVEPTIRSGLLGIDVSCSTSLPKSPDRIAGIKKPRRNSEANFTNWYVTIIFMPPLKVKAAYQSRLKYDAFN